MSKASKNLADKAKELRKEGSYEEALIAARAGVAEDDECRDILFIGILLSPRFEMIVTELGFGG